MGPLLPLKPRLVLLGLAIIFPLSIPSSNAAPVQSDGKTSREKGCYFMQKYYNSGEIINTGEKCLNCTCKENTLMCYLRVCPFVKPLGEDCIEEHMPNECCPKFWCPEVYPRVSTEKPEEEETGCYIDGTYYQEGARIPSNPLKACEVCYCIRNSSVCTMQQCELKVEGCSPQYRTGSCCPSRYNCSHLAATTLPPGILEELGDEQGCVHNGKRYADGEQVDSDDECTHCYCMKHEVVCAVEKCKAPGDGCIPVPPEDGQCCPQRYECPTTAIPTFRPTTELILQDAPASISSTITDASTSTTAAITEIPTRFVSDLSKEAKKAPEPIELTTVVKDHQTLVSQEISVTTQKTFTVAEDGVQTLIPQAPRVPKITDHPSVSTVLARNVTKRPVFFPGHIPGEGVCRNLNLTYANGQAVPSNDPCRTNCSCSSSVIHCDAVECTLVRPPGFSSCKTVRNKDGCCPRFECYTDNDTTLAGLTQTRFDATMTTTRVSIAEDTVLEQVQFPMTEQLDFGGISSTMAAEVKIKFTTSGMITTTISVPDSKESSTHMSIPTDVAFQQQVIDSDDTFIDGNRNVSFKEKTTTENLKESEMVETTSAVTRETIMPNTTKDVESFMTTVAKPVEASVTHTSLSEEIIPKEIEQPEISISDQESLTQTSTASADITSFSIMEASEDTSEMMVHGTKSTSKPTVTERVETKLSTLETEPSRDISSTFMKDAVNIESTTKLASMSTITEESTIKEISITEEMDEIVTSSPLKETTSSEATLMETKTTEEVEITSTSPTSSIKMTEFDANVTQSPALKETTSSETTLIETETTNEEVEAASTSPTSSSIKMTEFVANVTESLVSQKVATLLPLDLTTIKITTDKATLPFSDTQTKSTFDALDLTESVSVDTVTDATIRKGETLMPAAHKDDASTIASVAVMMKDQTMDKSTESTPLSTLFSTKVSLINEILITEASDAKKAHTTLVTEAAEESAETMSISVDTVTDATIRKGETLMPAAHKDDASTIASDAVMMKDQTVDKSTKSTPLPTLLATKVSVINEILATETSDAKKAHTTLVTEATEESAETMSSEKATSVVAEATEESAETTSSEKATTVVTKATEESDETTSSEKVTTVVTKATEESAETMSSEKATAVVAEATGESAETTSSEKATTVVTKATEENAETTSSEKATVVTKATEESAETTSSEKATTAVTKATEDSAEITSSEKATTVVTKATEESAETMSSEKATAVVAEATGDSAETTSSEKAATVVTKTTEESAETTSSEKATTVVTKATVESAETTSSEKATTVVTKATEKSAETMSSEKATAVVAEATEESAETTSSEKATTVVTKATEESAETMSSEKATTVVAEATEESAETTSSEKAATVVTKSTEESAETTSSEKATAVVAEATEESAETTSSEKATTVVTKATEESAEIMSNEKATAVVAEATGESAETTSSEKATTVVTKATEESAETTSGEKATTVVMKATGESAETMSSEKATAVVTEATEESAETTSSEKATTVVTKSTEESAETTSSEKATTVVTKATEETAEIMSNEKATAVVAEATGGSAETTSSEKATTVVTKATEESAETTSSEKATTVVMKATGESAETMSSEKATAVVAEATEESAETTSSENATTVVKKATGESAETMSSEKATAVVAEATEESAETTSSEKAATVVTKATEESAKTTSSEKATAVVTEVKSTFSETILSSPTTKSDEVSSIVIAETSTTSVSEIKSTTELFSTPESTELPSSTDLTTKIVELSSTSEEGIASEGKPILSTTHAPEKTDGKVLVDDTQPIIDKSTTLLEVEKLETVSEEILPEIISSSVQTPTTKSAFSEQTPATKVTLSEEIQTEITTFLEESQTEKTTSSKLKAPSSMNATTSKPLVETSTINALATDIMKEITLEEESSIIKVTDTSERVTMETSKEIQSITNVPDITQTKATDKSLTSVTEMSTNFPTLHTSEETFLTETSSTAPSKVTTTQRSSLDAVTITQTTITKEEATTKTPLPLSSEKSIVSEKDITMVETNKATTTTEMSTNFPTLHTSEETSSTVPSTVTTMQRSSSDAVALTQTTITKEKATTETPLSLSSEKSIVNEKDVTTVEISKTTTTKLTEAPSKSTDLPLDELQTMFTKTADKTKTEMTTDQSLKATKSTLSTIEKIEISTSSSIVLSDESKIPAKEGEFEAGVAEMLLHKTIGQQKTTKSNQAVTTPFTEVERISETENLIKTSEDRTTQHFVFDTTKTIEDAFQSDGLTSSEIPQTSLIADISEESIATDISQENKTIDISKGSQTASTSEESLATDILKKSVTTNIPEESIGTEISKEGSTTVISEESFMTGISKESTLSEVISQTATVDSKISPSELPEIQTEDKTITRLTTQISDDKASATAKLTTLKESSKTTMTQEDTTFVDKMLVTEPYFATDIAVSEIINATTLTNAATSPEVITIITVSESGGEEGISSKLPTVNPDVTMRSITTSPPSLVSQTTMSSISSDEQFTTTTQTSLIKEPARHASSDITLEIIETTTPDIETSSHEAEIATMFDINNKSFAQFPSRSRISTASVAADDEASTTPLITTLIYDISSIMKEPEVKKSTLSPTTRMIDLDNFTVVEMSTSSRNFSDLSITDEMQPVTLTTLQLETEMSTVPKTDHASTDPAPSVFTTSSDGSTQSTGEEMHSTIKHTVMEENISSVSPQPLTTITLSDMEPESLKTEEETFASSTLPSSKSSDVIHSETTSAKVVSEVSEGITDQIKEIDMKDKTEETSLTTEKFSTIEITTVPSFKEILTSDTKDAVKLTSIILTSETISLSDQQKFPASTTVESLTKIGTETTEIERKTEIEKVATQPTESLLTDKDKIEVSSSTLQTEDWTTPKHTTTQTIKDDEHTTVAEQRKSTTVTSSTSEASTTKVSTSELTTMEEPMTSRAGEAVSLEISTKFETVKPSELTTKPVILSTSETATKQEELVTSELTTKPVILDTSRTTTKSQTLSTSETATKQEELITSELTAKPVILDTSRTTTKSQTLSTSETATKQEELVTSELTTKPVILDTSETSTKQEELVTSELTTKPVILDTSRTTTKSQTLSTSETATKQEELVTSELTTKPVILDTSETSTKQEELVTSELTTKPVILDTSRTTTKSQTLSTSETATKQEELITSELTTKPVILDTSRTTTKSQTLSTPETVTKQEELVTSKLTTKPVILDTSKTTTKSQTLTPETTTKPEELVTSELTPKTEISVITETSQTTDFSITEKEAVKTTLAKISTTESLATSIESQSTLEHRSMEGRTSTLSPVIASSLSTENLLVTETEKPKTAEVSTLNTLMETSTLRMQTEKLSVVTDSGVKEPATATGLPISTTLKDESEKDAKITSPVTQNEGSSSAGLSEVTDAIKSWTTADIKTEKVFENVDMSTVIPMKHEVPLLVTTTTEVDHSSIIMLLDDHKTISDEVSTTSNIDQTTALFKTEVPATSTDQDELIKTAVTSSEIKQEETVTQEDIKRTTDENTVVTDETETKIVTTEMPTKIEFSTAEGVPSAVVTTEEAISVQDISKTDIHMKTTLLPEQATRSKTTKLLPMTSEQKTSTTAMFGETENPMTISSTEDEMLEKATTDATSLELATAETEIPITSFASIPVTENFSAETKVSISIHEDNETTFAETHTAATTSHFVTADKSTILQLAEAETLQSKTIIETDSNTEQVTAITEIPAVVNTNESLTITYDITSTKSSDAVSDLHEITSTPAFTEHGSTYETTKLKDAAMTTLLLSNTETDSESSLHTTTTSKTKSSVVTLSTSETPNTSTIVSDAAKMMPTVTTQKTERTPELLSTPVSLTTLADATISTTETTDCVVNGVSYADGKGIATIDPCEACHCALGEIVCFRKICDAASQGCMPRPGQEDLCCPVAFDCPIERGNLEKTSTETEANSTAATIIENKFSTIPSSTSSFITTESPNLVDETKFATLSSAELKATETGLVSEQTKKSSVATSVQLESETLSSTEKAATVSFAETSSSPSTVKLATKSSSDIEETVRAEHISHVDDANWKEKALQNTTSLEENVTKSFDSTTEHQIITEEAIIGMNGFSSLPRISEISFTKDTTVTEQTSQSSERPISTVLSTEVMSLSSESEITSETTLKPKSTKPEDSVFTFVTTTRHQGSSFDVESFTTSTKQAESSSITTKEDEAIVDFKTITGGRGIHVTSSDKDTTQISTLQDEEIISTEITSPAPHTDIAITEKIISQPIVHNMTNPVVTEKQENVTATQMLTEKQENITSTQMQTTEDISWIIGDTTTTIMYVQASELTADPSLVEETMKVSTDERTTGIFSTDEIVTMSVKSNESGVRTTEKQQEIPLSEVNMTTRIPTTTDVKSLKTSIIKATTETPLVTSTEKFLKIDDKITEFKIEELSTVSQTELTPELASETAINVSETLLTETSEIFPTQETIDIVAKDQTFKKSLTTEKSASEEITNVEMSTMSSEDVTVQFLEETPTERAIDMLPPMEISDILSTKKSPKISDVLSTLGATEILDNFSTMKATEKFNILSTQNAMEADTISTTKMTELPSTENTKEMSEAFSTEKVTEIFNDLSTKKIPEVTEVSSMEQNINASDISTDKTTVSKTLSTVNLIETSTTERVVGTSEVLPTESASKISGTASTDSESETARLSSMKILFETTTIKIVPNTTVEREISALTSAEKSSSEAVSTQETTEAFSAKGITDIPKTTFAQKEEETVSETISTEIVTKSPSETLMSETFDMLKDSISEKITTEIPAFTERRATKISIVEKVTEPESTSTTQELFNVSENFGQETPKASELISTTKSNDASDVKTLSSEKTTALETGTSSVPTVLTEKITTHIADSVTEISEGSQPFKERTVKILESSTTESVATEQSEESSATKLPATEQSEESSTEKVVTITATKTTRMFSIQPVPDEKHTNEITENITTESDNEKILKLSTSKMTQSTTESTISAETTAEAFVTNDVGDKVLETKAVMTDTITENIFNETEHATEILTTEVAPSTKQKESKLFGDITNEASVTSLLTSTLFVEKLPEVSTSSAEVAGETKDILWRHIVEEKTDFELFTTEKSIMHTTQEITGSQFTKNSTEFEQTTISTQKESILMTEGVKFSEPGFTVKGKRTTQRITTPDSNSITEKVTNLVTSVPIPKEVQTKITTAAKIDIENVDSSATKSDLKSEFSGEPSKDFTDSDKLVPEMLDFKTQNITEISVEETTETETLPFEISTKASTIPSSSTKIEAITDKLTTILISESSTPENLKEHVPVNISDVVSESVMTTSTITSPDIRFLPDFILRKLTPSAEGLDIVDVSSVTTTSDFTTASTLSNQTISDATESKETVPAFPQTSAMKDESKTTPSKSQRAEPIAEDVVSGFEFGTSSIGTSSPSSSTISSTEVVANDQPRVDDQLSSSQATPTTDNSKIFSTPSNVTSKTPEWMSSTTEQTTLNNTETTTVTDDFFLDEDACIFEGRIHHSAEQIPRPDPCEFCFCFRSDVICLQQSCPPPLDACQATPIHGYCCPRFECPIYVTSRNLTRASQNLGNRKPVYIQRRDKREIDNQVEVTGCDVKGSFYEIGQTVKSASGPCLHCQCDLDGMMRCDPRKCKPEAPLMLKLNPNFFRRR